MNKNNIFTTIAHLCIGIVTIATLIVPTAIAQAQFYTSTGYTNSSSGYTSNPVQYPNQALNCINLYSNLTYGAYDRYTGGQVSQLQSFLISQGFMNFGPTGFYGSLTFAAVQNFQATHAIQATGGVGPITRAAIHSISCGSTVTPPYPQPIPTPVYGVPVVTSLSSSYGAVGSSITIYGSGFSSTNTIMFGSGVVNNVYSSDGRTMTFTVPSSIGPNCTGNQVCPMYIQLVTAGSYPIAVQNAYGTSNSVTFTVTSGSINNSGMPVISSLYPTTGSVGSQVTVYGSGFSSDNTVNFGGGVIPHITSSNGTMLTFIVPNTINPPCLYSNPACYVASQQTQNGSYTVSIQNSYGTSNGVTYYVTNASTGGYGTPIISGIDSPTNLAVGQSGVWTVRAIDQTGGGLSYSVTWGDENQYPYAYASQQSYSQTSTFTHVYNQPGTYTARFTVRGNNSQSQNGQTAQSSVTITVGSNSNQYNTYPTISSISPTSGAFGTSVTIYGSGFTQYNNAINFAGTSNVVTGLQSTDGTTLHFIVPATPCSAGVVCAQVALQPGTYPISVTNQNGVSNNVYFNATSGSTGRVNQSITLSLGQTGNVNDLQITPTNVTEDSRCPTGVYCIQAGKVVVQTSLHGPNTSTVSQLQFGSSNSIANVDGYTVKITDVQPIKYQNSTINQYDYRFTFQVTR